jgi:hypothetical protein
MPIVPVSVRLSLVRRVCEAENSCDRSRQIWHRRPPELPCQYPLGVGNKFAKQGASLARIDNVLASRLGCTKRRGNRLQPVLDLAALQLWIGTRCDLRAISGRIAARLRIGGCTSPTISIQGSRDKSNMQLGGSFLVGHAMRATRTAWLRWLQPSRFRIGSRTSLLSVRVGHRAPLSRRRMGTTQIRC